MGKPGSNNNLSEVQNIETKEKLLENNGQNVVVEITSSRKISGGGVDSSSCFVPPDGGWGWVVCLASFLCNGIIFGVMNCFGVLFVKLKDRFGQPDQEAAFVTAWVGSVSIGTTFLLSPVASILTDKWGIRITSFLGGLLATTGMLVSAFVTKLELLYITYGVILGSGASLAYTPSLVVLGHYFKRRLGLVNGIVTAGSSAFTMAMPLLLRYLLDTVDLSRTLQILALMMACLMLCALSFRPILSEHERISEVDAHSSKESLPNGACTKFWSSMLDTSIWKNKKYQLWVIAIPTALFGYFVPYVHLVQHVKDILPEANGEVLVTCIGFTSGIGRIVFGKLADIPSINRIILQQVAFISIGVLTMVLVLSNHFIALVVICLFLGLFDGCFISLLGPIAFDIVGHKGASQAIGFLLGLCSIPLTVGPPIAGLLHDHFKNYTAAFLAAGVPPLVGATLLCFVHKIPKEKDSSAKEELEKVPFDTNKIKDVVIEKNETNGKIPLSEKTPMITPSSPRFANSHFAQPENCVS